MKPNASGAAALDTWVELLTSRAATLRDAPACTFLVDGDDDAHTLSYAELDRRARSLAAHLQDAAGVEERALLLLPPGLDFAIAFFACLYAGLVAVPVPPPTRARGLPRLLAIARDCRPSVILTTEEFGKTLAVAGHDGELAPLGRMRVLSAALSRDAAACYRRPSVHADTVAFLQYTSGSTGTPKGVVLTHANLLHNERSIQQAFQHTAESVVVGWLPPFHDMGLIGNLLQPLFVGGHGIQMAPAHFLVKPTRWLSAISRYRATTSGGPNFAYDLCVQKIPEDERARLDLSSWRVAFNGAEPVRAATLSRFSRAFAVSGFQPGAFYPCYGLAEATLLVSGGRVGAGPTVAVLERGALEAGRFAPLSGTAALNTTDLVGAGVPWGAEVRVVDPETYQPCEPGRVGEIWVRGPSVARGYWERESETDATYRARTTDHAGPFLRTGDLGTSWEGELFVTGRLKDLIIVRGRNLYPQDLEIAAEESYAGLSTGAAAAFSIEYQDGGHSEERVVIVQEVGAKSFDCQAAARAIESAIADRFEIAVHAVVLIKRGTLPRTTSGKVRRSTCRQRLLDGSLAVVWSSLATPVGAAVEQLATPTNAQDEGAPRGELERQLQTIWAEVLTRRVMGRDEQFLLLGGDSLRALQINAQVHALLGIELSPVQLFETTTIASLASWIEARAIQSHASALPARPASAERGEFPLSRAQQRLWFLEQLVGGKPVHHIAGALRLVGTLDTCALARAVSALVARHPALRTTFHAAAGRPLQRVAAAADVTLPVLRARDRAEIETAFQVLRQPFDLTASPARWLLVQRDEREHWLGFSCHHLVADGLSLTIVVRELLEIYQALTRGDEHSLTPLACDYSDYVALEMAGETAPARAAAIAYWSAQFSRQAPPLDMPGDRAPGGWPTYAGARAAFSIPPALVAALVAAGRRVGATPFAVFAAGFAVLLHRYTGQDDFCIGSPVSVRPSRALSSMVGCCLNTLALRMDLSGNPSVKQLLVRVRDTVNQGLRHHELPFEHVLRVARPDRETAQGQLFRTMLSLQPPMPSLPVMEGLDVSVEQLDTGAAQVDLSLDLTPSSDGTLVRAAWEYNTDLFDAETMQRLTQHFLELLSGMAANPALRVSELPIGSDAEWRAGFAEASPRGEHVGLPAHLLFEVEAERRPMQEAVVCGQERLSYAELNGRANQLARHLRERGVRPERRVGIYLERSSELVIGTLAVLKAGGCYVPLDTTSPTERIAHTLADAGVAVLVTTRALASGLPEPRPRLVLVDEEADSIASHARHDPSYAGNLHQLAYVLLTSGTTGRPKGVMVSHQTLLQTLDGWQQSYLHGALTGDGLRVLSVASSAFDVWTADWVRALCAGGTLVLAPRDIALDPVALTRVMMEERVTLVDLVPALAKQLASAWCRRGQAAESLRLLIVGSDVWSMRDLRGLQAACPRWTRILSCYGVTEATIDSAALEPDKALDDVRESPVPLGRATPGTRLHVLDTHGQPLPWGVPGELAIGGYCVARGYLDRPALTAHRFVPDPFGPQGARLYRTGDRARRRADGTLEFLGRIDDQVKLRGVRIESAEIEACLKQCTGVVEAAVVMQELAGSPRGLVAFVVLDSERPLDAAALRAFLRRTLPEVMVPSAFVALPALPLTPNGKIDRRALTAQRVATQPANISPVPPRTELERAIAESFCRVLSVERVNLDENFFDLGGHSLLLAELASDLGARLDREVSLLSLLQHPSVASLATALRGDELAAPAQAAPDEAAPLRRAELFTRRRRVQESDQ